MMIAAAHSLLASKRMNFRNDVLQASTLNTPTLGAGWRKPVKYWPFTRGTRIAAKTAYRDTAYETPDRADMRRVPAGSWRPGRRTFAAGIARDTRDVDRLRNYRYPDPDDGLFRFWTAAGNGGTVIPLTLVPISIVAAIVIVFGMYLKLTDRNRP